MVRMMIHVLVKECGFIQSRANPCLLLVQFEDGKVVVAVQKWWSQCKSMQTIVTSMES